MLEEKDYTISELAAIIGGSSNRQAIKRKLDRRHILYSIQGTGSNATFKIEKIPSPFQEFCMDVLKFSKNTDFEKLCNFYYYCLNDELFMAKPDEEKAMLLEDKGKHISRQTIAGYERKLFDVYFYSKSDTEFIYYFASDGNYRTAEHEEYLEAWHDYWEWKEQAKKELGNLRYVCARIKLKYGGFPRKQGIIQANAIEMPQIRKLIALTNESFEKAYSK